MMDPDDFVLQKDGNVCVGALVAFDAPDDNMTDFVFIIGALFMKNVMTIFDLGGATIGFGRLKETNRQFGEYSIVPAVEMTALGTGPYATLKPTLTIPLRTRSLSSLLMVGPLTVSLTPPAVTIVPGTGAINPNITQTIVPTGVSTSSGASIAITSNIPQVTNARYPIFLDGSITAGSQESTGGQVTLTSTVTASSAARRLSCFRNYCGVIFIFGMLVMAFIIVA